MKNAILKLITVIAFLIFITSVAGMDSERPAPVVVAMVLSLGWLALFAKVNEEVFDGRVY